LRRRDHGRDVAYGEDVTRPRLRQDSGIDAGVGATDDQDLGRLALHRELLEQVEMLTVVAQAEIREALEKPIQSHGVF
jgi:hypothetical protein